MLFEVDTNLPVPHLMTSTVSHVQYSARHFYKAPPFFMLAG